MIAGFAVSRTRLAAATRCVGMDRIGDAGRDRDQVAGSSRRTASAIQL